MGRSPCCDEMDVKKGPWTPEEDKKLVDYIQKHGLGSWRNLPKGAGLRRCGKSCRLRWTNYLRPDIKRGKFSEDEEGLIVHLHSVLGNKWSMMAAHLPGRTDNEIKNYWNTHIKKKLLLMGIDPVTHRRRTDLDIFMNWFPNYLTAAANTTGNNGNMTNPFDDAMTLQAYAANLARLQMLQTLIQTLASCPPLPPLLSASTSVDALNLLASFSLHNNQLDHKLEGILNGSLVLGQDQVNRLTFSNYVSTLFPNDAQQQAGSNDAILERTVVESPLTDPSSSGVTTTVGSHNSPTYSPAAFNTSAAIPTAQSTPSLTSSSSENLDADCTEPSNSHCSSPLDAYWQGLNLEGLVNDFTWKDMLDQIPWPNDQFYSNMGTNHGGAGS